MKQCGYTVSICLFIIVSVAVIVSCQSVNAGTGKTGSVSFSVLNGERCADFLLRMKKQGVTDTATVLSVMDRAQLCVKYPFLPARVAGIRKLEGMFVPGEYVVPLPENALDNREKRTEVILLFLLEQTKKRIGTISDHGVLSRYEEMILASIVEKEAAFNIQYQETANVLYKRFLQYKKGGNTGCLSCCSTVEYVLGYHRPFLITADLQAVKNSPYNTYYHGGLPPTPIAFFSESALRAVENPKATANWFFVMDWTAGKILFNSRYQNHQKDIQKVIGKIYRQCGNIVHKRIDGYYYDYFPKHPEMVKG